MGYVVRESSPGQAMTRREAAAKKSGGKPKQNWDLMGKAKGKPKEDGSGKGDEAVKKRKD